MSRDYNKFHVWKNSYRFLLDVYVILNKLPEFEERNIKDQFRRAATSICLNIVEGSSSRSNKVFLNHLNYSYGSAKECDVLLLLCKDLNYITFTEFDVLKNNLEQLKSQLYLFMISVEKEITNNQQNFIFL